MKIANNEISEGYKTTELEPLPEEWKVVRLNKLFKEVN
jgi:hypothetical protein